MNTFQDKFKSAYLRLIKALDAYEYDTTELKNDLIKHDELDLIQMFDAGYNEAFNEKQFTKYKDLLFQIGELTLDMSEAMMNPPDAEKMCILTTNSDAMYRIEDWPRYAGTIQEALAAFKGLIVTHRIFLDDISVSENNITFRSKGVDVIKIEPLKFQSMNESGRLQVEACFKNLQEIDTSKAILRLMKLPGMKSLKISSLIKVNPNEKGKALLPSVKTTVKIIRDFLNDLKIIVPLNIAQELTAQFLIGHSWQVLSSTTKKTTDNCVMPPVMISEGTYGEESNIRYYRAYADGLWAFSQSVDSRKLYPEINPSMLGKYPFHCAAALEPIPYIHPFEQDPDILKKDWDREYVLNFKELQQLYYDEEMDDEFIGVITEDLSLSEKHLRELFFIDLDSDSKIKALNKITGEEQYLRIKNYIFSLDETHVRTMLRVEIAGSDELPINDAKYIYTYKAEIRKSFEGKWKLLSDYGKEIFMDLENFDDDDIDKLVEFTQILSFNFHR